MGGRKSGWYPQEPAEEPEDTPPPPTPVACRYHPGEYSELEIRLNLVQIELARLRGAVNGSIYGQIVTLFILLLLVLPPWSEIVALFHRVFGQ